MALPGKEGRESKAGSVSIRQYKVPAPRVSIICRPGAAGYTALAAVCDEKALGRLGDLAQTIEQAARAGIFDPVAPVLTRMEHGPPAIDRAYLSFGGRTWVGGRREGVVFEAGGGAGRRRWTRSFPKR